MFKPGDKLISTFYSSDINGDVIKQNDIYIFKKYLGYNYKSNNNAIILEYHSNVYFEKYFISIREERKKKLNKICLN